MGMGRIGENVGHVTDSWVDIWEGHPKVLNRYLSTFTDSRTGYVLSMSYRLTSKVSDSRADRQTNNMTPFLTNHTKCEDLLRKVISIEWKMKILWVVKNRDYIILHSPSSSHSIKIISEIIFIFTNYFR